MKGVAGCPYPTSESDFDFLKNKGIKAIVNLTKELPRYKSEYNYGNFDLINIRVKDFSIPSEDQIKEIWKLYRDKIDKGEKLVFHCLGGCGRTGTILAILLILHDSAITADQAISTIRDLQPCSFETDEQTDFVHQIFLDRDKFVN